MPKYRLPITLSAEERQALQTMAQEDCLCKTAIIRRLILTEARHRGLMPMGGSSAANQPCKADGLPSVLAFFAYLWTTRQLPPPEVSTIRLLIIAVAMVLVVVALVAVGAPDQVSNTLAHWPLIP